MNKNIIAFAGSNSSESINKQLVVYTMRSLAEHHVHLLDLNDYEMPIYSFDRERENGVPDKARQFIDKMKDCDAIICSFAEHNGNFTVAFKNVFDWCSRVDRNIFFKKPMLIMSTSPGRLGGANVMEIAKKTLPLYGANIVGSFSLPYFGQNFINGEITDKALVESHREAVELFKKSFSCLVG